MNLTQEELNLGRRYLHLFTVDGKPADEILTHGQICVFISIVLRKHKRLHIMTCTQYGKSLSVALACIILSCIFDRMVTVVAPTEAKAKIIMRYYTQHLSDNILFSSKLAIDSKIERLQTEQTKERISLKGGGGIYILSVEAGNAQSGFEKAMGEGSADLICDESALIPDTHEATLFRMIAGKGENAMYVKIGNPFYRNHFYRSHRSPLYTKIEIDYRQALKEGRYSSAFIEEAREKPLFSILYENKFPKAEALDKDGYYPLLTEYEVDNAYMDIDLPFVGEKFMGIDLASTGDNKSVITIRADNIAKRVYADNLNDQMVLITLIAEFARKYNVPIDDKHIIPDRTGAPAFCDRLRELYPVSGLGTSNNFGIIAGSKADQEDDGSILYLNRRAQNIMRMADWIKKGGKLYPRGAFDDLLDQRYKIQSDKKIKIKSKDEMRSEGIASPDNSDALSFTFNKKKEVIIGRPFKQGALPQSQYGL